MTTQTETTRAALARAHADWLAGGGDEDNTADIERLLRACFADSVRFVVSPDVWSVASGGGRWQVVPAEFPDTLSALCQLAAAGVPVRGAEADCPDCRGIGGVQVGTGQPNGEGGEEWTVEDCERCGGTGRLLDPPAAGSGGEAKTASAPGEGLAPRKRAGPAACPDCAALRARLEKSEAWWECAEGEIRDLRARLAEAEARCERLAAVVRAEDAHDRAGGDPCHDDPEPTAEESAARWAAFDELRVARAALQPGDVPAGGEGGEG